MASTALHEFVAGRSKLLPQAKAIGLVSSDGTLINGSNAVPLPKADLSQRDYFTYLRDHDDRGVFVSAPARSLNGSWTFFLARRINDRHGVFAGVVVGLVDAEYLEEFYRAISPNEGDAVMLLRRDGTTLIRHPHLDAVVGEALPAKSPWYALVARGGGTFRTTSFLSATPRIIATHVVRDYPLAINVGVSEDTALAAWRREALLIAAAALGAVIGYAILFRALAARSRRLERRTAEVSAVAQALRESEARFRDFATITSDWLWESDPDHRFTYISESARRFGHEPSAILGRTRAEVAAPSDRDRAKWDQHMAVLDRHEPFRDFVYTRDIEPGVEKIVSVSGNPVFDTPGRFLGYRGTARDVTAQALSERSLHEAKLAAEAANISKSQFLANISHELRTPLNAIIGFSDMMMTGIAGPLGGKIEEYSRIINASGKHLLHIVNDLLDIAKIDAGKFSLQREPIEPAPFAEACIEMVREAANDQELMLSVEVEPEMPAFQADARRLKQVMLNLLSNAIKFTEPGGSVVLRLGRTEDDTILFEVRDTGLGMSADELAIAMEPFGQVDAGLNRRHDGAGLGLPLARSLVEQHGGRLRIDSEKGRGTIVTVTLPPVPSLPETGDEPPSSRAEAA
jgi:PAS domain S-box-containing protein